MAKAFKFNLLIKKQRVVVNEVVTYINSYAKYIIVITQLIVLVVFFIKIVLDQTVIDLKETIDQKNQIILAAEEMITHNNQLATKLGDITGIVNANEYQLEVLNGVLKNIPKSITLGVLNLTEKSLIINGETHKPLDLQRLQIRLDKEIKAKVEITKLSKQFNLYEFELTITDEKEN